jgi:UDP-N-acetylglucosamine transferase subunit ALG13
MIYLTVGNFRVGFDRLITAMDTLAPSLGDTVLAQIGNSSVLPQHMQYISFAPFAEHENHIKNAAVVVAHAGLGTIMQAQQFSVPIVVVPRRKKYGEHYTDHQQELCRVMQEERHPNIFVVEEMTGLEAGIRAAMSAPRCAAGQTGTGRERIVTEMRRFLQGAGFL